MRQLTFPGLFVVLVVSSGCCAVPQQVCCSPIVTAGEQGVIFAVDGAGGFHATSQALRQAVSAEHVPVRVTTVEWSHGPGRVLADEMDCRYSREAGAQLAQEIVAFRAAYPSRAVYLVGHSAGSAVVLAAAEHVPPGSIERIVLLAPSVSADYDIRSALRAVRSGLDVFYSRRDTGYLGVGVAVIGTADGYWGRAAAGRVGFRVPPTGDDAALFTKLHQHAWDPAVAWTGNHGGHYGCYEAWHLRKYVLPLLTPAVPPNRPTCATPG